MKQRETHIPLDLEDTGNAPASVGPDPGQHLGPLSQTNRDNTMWNIRDAAKVRQYNTFIPPTAHPNNGDEAKFQADANFSDRYIASFTKGLPLAQGPNGARGEVDPNAYRTLLEALGSGDFDDFEQVPLGSLDCVAPRSLENPQASLAYDLAGTDSHDFFVPVTGNAQRVGFPPAPTFDSAEQIGEIAENYWMALLRDTPFINYDADALSQAAAADLNNFIDFRGSKDPAGNVTTRTLFRGTLPGDEVGFYVSQFFLRHIPYGAQRLDGRIRPLPRGIDFMTTEANWLRVQRGCDFRQECELAAGEPERVFMRNGRDLAQFVHVDNVYYGPFNACLQLVSGSDTSIRCERTPGFGAPFAQGIPYRNIFADPTKFPPSPSQSRNQVGIATFGPNHLKTLLLEAMNRALKAVWFQKWSVHRRLRPETFAGRIHFRLAQNIPLTQYPFNMGEFAKLGSQGAGGVLDRIFAHNQAQNGGGTGTYLLPMAYAEGSPIHPSYGQGHATAAGAGVTILKAFFQDLTFRELEARVFRVKANGERADAGSGAIRDTTTVHGELNKLASNISLARNFAGVHYRSDYFNSVLLGEQVAIQLLEDYFSTFNERFEIRFRMFNGQFYTLAKNASGPDIDRA